MKYRRFSSIILFILIVALVACKHKNQANNEANNGSDSLIFISKAQFDQMKMQTGKLQNIDFDDVINVRGMADVPPQSKATVSPVVGGSVKEIFVRAGDRVNKGQALLSFEGMEIVNLQQSYLEISAQLKSLESEYKRQQTLFAENISSEKLFLEAQSAFNKAEVTCEGLKRQLLLLNINTEKIESGKITSSAILYAPIAGDVIQINTNISQFIQPSDVVVEIADTRQIQLYLSVFEKDITLIKPEQRVLFSLPETSDKLFKAKITKVGKAIDNDNRTASVQAQPTEDAPTGLLTGMYVDAKIVVDTKSVWAVPIDAIISEENEHFLLLMQSYNENQYVFEKVKVQTGKQNGDLMEIFLNETVTPSSTILLKGVYNAI